MTGSSDEVVGLKPCPFCGGDNIQHVPGLLIACMNINCGAQMEMSPPWGGPKKDGIAFLVNAWNTRPPPPARVCEEGLGSVAGSAEADSALPRGRQAGSAKPSGVRYSAPHLRPGPWRYERGWVWAPSLKGGETHVADVRGWGHLIGSGHGALGLSEDEARRTQDVWGRTIAEAVNAHYAALEGVAITSASDGEARTGDSQPATEHKDLTTQLDRLMGACKPFVELYREITTDYGVDWFPDEGRTMRHSLDFPTAKSALVWRHFRLLKSALDAVATEGADHD